METIAIIGAGTMGRGIAEVAAMAGYSVLLYDAQPEVVQKAIKGLEHNLQRHVEKGRLKEPVTAVLARVKAVGLEDCAGASIAIEAVPETLEIKQSILAKLGDLNPGMVLATNTSTLSISAIAAKITGPERVVGMHFFNPVQRMQLVEVVPGIQTSPETAEKVFKLAQAWDKDPIKVRDYPGFLVNRIARPFYGEALRIHGENVPRAQIDWIIKGLGFPMGPFELMDLIGLDVNLAASRSVYEGFFGEAKYRPHPLQAQRVAAGLLGRKTGRGWYRYPEGLPVRPAAADAASPVAYIVGPNALAKEMQRFKHTPDVSKADFVLDCRIDLKRKLDFAEDLPVVTLVWGHSVSAALKQYGNRPVAGFSLVPAVGEAAVAEISGENNRATKLAQQYFSAHGHLALHLKDQPGGIGFRILALVINEAISVLAEGNSADDIDRAMRMGMAHPRGPIEWAKIIGLKPVLRALEGLQTELGEIYRPHPLLRQMART
jgi:3-hydroxybutyryl-CoA dehydrogenase